ncbi:ABC transporter ATP-binding protein [Nakamurella aerolata]|uniref:ABC transporter ATP-binding protein n=1 Tax=Nakamurella aerolata TaxID=1656892 RepID=UPI001BB15ABD
MSDALTTTAAASVSDGVATGTTDPAGAGRDLDVILDIADLSVAYATGSGDLVAVKDVNLQVRRGEILGIAGESGSGKTTMAATLLRLLKKPGRVSGGTAQFFPGSAPEGVDLLAITGNRLRRLRWSSLSYLPQGSMNSLNPVARIERQFADVILEHAPKRKAELPTLIPRLLQQVGLDPSVARSYPHELSGGMRQRVLMAIAISLEPDLIVADEPTTALDVTVQRVILQTLADLSRDSGVTIILISHDMGVHAQLADRVAVMLDGAVVEVGEVRQVFHQPQHEYTRRLIESIPKLAGAAVGVNAGHPVATGEDDR